MNSEVRSQVAGPSSQVSALRSRATRHKSQVASVVVAALVLGAATGVTFFSPKTVAAEHKTQFASSQHISRVSLPLFFEPNQGQTDPRVKFLARGVGYGLFLTSDEAVLTLENSAAETRLAASSPKGQGTASVIRMHLEGANTSARVAGAQQLPGKSNYFIGNDPGKWRTGIPQFARVNYESVYPGVDLTYYGNQRQLEYDFRVAPDADPNQIALSFDGATTRIDAGELVLSTPQGDVRFHAPQIYQQVGSGKKTVSGNFCQLAANKIGFEIGAYDHSRELVIDPVLSFATFLGGTGDESFTRIAVDSGLNMYVAASTTSPSFQGNTLHGGSDILVAKISADGSSLTYTTYLGGDGDEPFVAGIALIPDGNSFDATVAGTTTSSNFPHTANAFQQSASGIHGFLTRLDSTGGLGTGTSAYSTYLAGNGTDTITGLAVDKHQQQHAFVTGITTSTNFGDGFPSTLSAFQVCPFLPGINCTIASGPRQFFASQINTAGNGNGSMLYSTYIGGNNPTNAVSIGGGITVDASERMYLTGSTNMLGVTGSNGEHPFPLLNAQQSCLNEAGLTGNCAPNPPITPDAILVKINPAIVGAGSLVYSTYLGGSDVDRGNAVSVDSSGNAYVTGETFSTPWNLNSSLQGYGQGGDAFIAKVGNPTGSSPVYPLTYFTYLGGGAEDSGQDIVVDNVQAAHVTGWTDSSDFPVSAQNNLQPRGGARDAFVALVSTTGTVGTYSGYLGGSGLDQGTSIALDPNLDSSPTFMAGITESSDFLTHTQPKQLGLQPTFGGGIADSFVAKIGSKSTFTFDTSSGINPTPAAVGNQVTFTFIFDNTGPDPAANVVFSGALPSSGFTFSSATSTPGGTCPNPVGGVVTCNVTTVASGSKATINVVLVPTSGTTSLSVTPSISANGDAFVTPNDSTETVAVTDFKISASPTSATITAGQSTSYVLTLDPTDKVNGYKSSISVSHSSLPTGATGTFTSSSVTISGGTAATTTLNISTTARPVQSGSRFHGGGALYATWLPVGGLSLLGFGVGVKKRRWIMGTLFGLLAAVILFQPACGNSSSSTPTSGGTPVGTYSITLTGSSGSASHTTTVTLNVK